MRNYLDLMEDHINNAYCTQKKHNNMYSKQNNVSVFLKTLMQENDNEKLIGMNENEKVIITFNDFYEKIFLKFFFSDYKLSMFSTCTPNFMSNRCYLLFNF